MSIKKMGAKGIYWCSFYPAPGAPRVRQSLHTTDKAEAQKAEARLKLEHEEKAKHWAEGITLKEAFIHAMRVRDSWRSAKSLPSIYNIYDQVVKHFGEGCSLSALDDETMLEYGEQLSDDGLTASTINKRFSLVAVLFDEAITWKKFAGRKPNTIRYKVKNGRRRLISIQEQVSILTILHRSTSPYEHAMADLVVILADTGLRLSEALNLQAQHLNVEAKAILVVDTKTDEDRIVPVTDRAMLVLTRRAQLNRQLFHPLNAFTASHIWRRVRAKMGLEHEREFVLHAFRHTYGSTLANGGVDAFRIQKAMGHKVIATTQRYVKVATSALDGLADIMSSKWDQKYAQNTPKQGVYAGVTLGEMLEETIGYPGTCSTVNPQVPGSSPGRGANNSMS